MQNILYILGCLFVALGVIFMLTSIVGFAKFKDPFKMMHVGGVCDLISGPLIMLGCGIIFASDGDISTLFKIFLTIIIIYITSPISTNAISEAASMVNKQVFVKK